MAGRTGRRTPARAWVGLDLGTSGLKGVAVDDDGRVIARAQAGYPTSRPEPIAAQQDPHNWVRAVEVVVRQLLASVPGSSWAGIGLSAMLPTLVTLAADGAPLGPAVTWEDGRAEVQGDRFREHVGADELYRRTGQWVDGRYLLPMYARLLREEPARAAATVTLVGAKDYLMAVLTGHVVTDPSTAAGFGVYDLDAGAWAPDLVAAAERCFAGDRQGPGDGHAFPALARVVDSRAAFPLTAEAAGRLGLPAGLPVSVGAADSVLGAAGMGVDHPGEVAYVAGTSTVVLGIADTLVHDPLHRLLVTPTAEPGRWGFEMDLLSTGSAVRWLGGLLGGTDERTALALAAAADPDRTPVFLPYVAPGEQGALWDPALTGALSGLTLAHGAGDLHLALVQGVVLESVRCLHVLEELGFPRGTLAVAGGSAADPWFRQQLADASGREVLAPVDGDSDFSALGAALVARTSASRTAATGTSAGRAAPGGRDGVERISTYPRGEAAARWERLGRRHDEALARHRSGSVARNGGAAIR